MTHVWYWRVVLPDRKGQPCRVLARGNGRGPRNVLVEFADGYRVVTTRFAIRRTPPASEPTPGEPTQSGEGR